MQFSTKIDGFEQKDSQGFENSYNSLWTIPIREIFNFHHIYQNYTLALTLTLTLIHLLLWTKSQMITLALTLCHLRYHRRSKLSPEQMLDPLWWLLLKVIHFSFSWLTWGFPREHAVDALQHSTSLERAAEWALTHPPRSQVNTIYCSSLNNKKMKKKKVMNMKEGEDKDGGGGGIMF